MKRILLFLITVISLLNAVGQTDSKIMFLNAYNFDFGQKSLKSNYVGHLNIFAPRLKNSSSTPTKWGFNTGIMKIDYGLGQDDSLNNGRPIIENVKISPLDDLKDNSKYLKQLNNYKTETQNTVWSFYVQPLYEITNVTSKQHLYLHAHLELLASKYSAKTTITTLKQDTAIYLTANNPVVRSGISNESTYVLNTAAGYFGAGLTFDTHPWKNGSFFIQPTVGVTTNKVSLSNIEPSRVYILNRTRNAFYMVRAYYTEKLGAKSTLVIGMDIRGLFPTYAPQYAAYAGINVDIDALVALLK